MYNLPRASYSSEMLPVGSASAPPKIPRKPSFAEFKKKVRFAKVPDMIPDAHPASTSQDDDGPMLTRYPSCAQSDSSSEITLRSARKALIHNLALNQQHYATTYRTALENLCTRTEPESGMLLPSSPYLLSGTAFDVKVLPQNAWQARNARGGAVSSVDPWQPRKQLRSWHKANVDFNEKMNWLRELDQQRQRKFEQEEEVFQAYTSSTSSLGPGSEEESDVDVLPAKFKGIGLSGIPEDALGKDYDGDVVMVDFSSDVDQVYDVDLSDDSLFEGEVDDYLELVQHHS